MGLLLPLLPLLPLVPLLPPPLPLLPLLPRLPLLPLLPRLPRLPRLPPLPAACARARPHADLLQRVVWLLSARSQVGALARHHMLLPMFLHPSDLQPEMRLRVKLAANLAVCVTPGVIASRVASASSPSPPVSLRPFGVSSPLSPRSCAELGSWRPRRQEPGLGQRAAW